MLRCLTQEREELLAHHEAEREELNEELTALQQERDESLLLAENEKQQVAAREGIGRGLLGLQKRGFCRGECLASEMTLLSLQLRISAGCGSHPPTRIPVLPTPSSDC